MDTRIGAAKVRTIALMCRSHIGVAREPGSEVTNHHSIEPRTGRQPLGSLTLASRSLVGIPAWLTESGLESYTVLQVVQSRQTAGVQGHGNSPEQPASYGQNVGPSEIGRRGSLACVPKEAGHPAGGWRPSVDFI